MPTMCPIRINFLPVHSNGEIPPSIKMAEEILSSYDAQLDTKCQKLLECVLTGNSKLYLGKVYAEEQLAKLNEEEVENFLIITKLNFGPDGKVIGALSH